MINRSDEVTNTARVFLDANILFSVAYIPTSGLMKLWQLPDLQLCTSTYAIQEAERNLHTDDQRSQLHQLLSQVEISSGDFVVMPPDKNPDYGLPKKDQPILWAAIDMKATHLLTGDKRDFGHLYNKKIEGVLILRPAPFIKLCEERIKASKPKQ